MTQDELLDLRKRILGDVMPLVVDSAGSAPDRFELLLRIIQSGEASAELYSKAYETARAIDSNEEKIDALMLLVDQIDFEIQSSDVEDAAALYPSQQQNTPVQ